MILRKSREEIPRYSELKIQNSFCRHDFLVPVITFITGHYFQGSQEQEVKFQDRIFSWFHEAQNTENARFSILTNLNHRNVTKAMLH